MSNRKARYRRHRCPPELISYSVWAYHRFTLSSRDVEELLAERCIIVPSESIRRWCLKFRPRYQWILKRREGRLGDHRYADEVFVAIQAQIHYLWRAVYQDGTLLDILVQPRRDAKAAKRCFERARLDDEWARTVRQVRADHHRKSSFMPGFEGLVEGMGPSDEPWFLDGAKAHWRAKERSAR